ncbi:sugar phosphate isomerase/epimerase family protein [Neolewinella sp.]|uniref:sugar phosphate isomerase/epimerase family protein n=1 Tax=Neolewinella sp. TaxID=2993543 RepID=UPI003B51B234
MYSSSRRSFIYQSVLTTAGFSLLGCGGGGHSTPTDTPATTDTMATDETTTAVPYLDTLGIQLWTVREQMAADPRATLQALADLGYQQVELMDTRDITRLKPICDEYGLAVNSSFIQWTAITGRWDLLPDAPRITVEEILEQANAGGLSHLIFGYMLPEEHKTADDWKRHIESANNAAMKAQAAGLNMAYHNHNFEWEPVDGTTGWELLKEHMDGSLLPFELDLGWAAMAGQDPAQVLESVKNRVSLLHIKNLVDLPQPYVTIESMPADKFTELGAGRLDIPALMRQGQKAGVTYCFYEQDNNYSPDALSSAERSIEFLED